MAHSKTPALHELSNLVDDIKGKVSDGEYLKIMNTMGELFKQVGKLENGAVQTAAQEWGEAGAEVGAEEMWTHGDPFVAMIAELAILPVDEEEDEDEEEEDDLDDYRIELTEDMKVTVAEKNYYKTSIGAYDNVLISYPIGEEVIGILDEDGVTIHEIAFE